jgi:Tfp pilus tip-associated adhesin PilY1
MEPCIKLTLYFLVAAVGLTGRQVTADATVNPLTQPLWSIGAYTLKQPGLGPGTTEAYRTWFENGAWQGDIIEYDVDNTGKHSTDVTVGAHPVSDGNNNWSARFEFAQQQATVADYWKSANGRKIISWDGNRQVAFRWGSLSASQRTLLDPAAKTGGAYDSPVLNFVRGDRSQESPGGLLRKRYGLLGDTGNVQPLYIGAPSRTLPHGGHVQYRTNQANRPGRVIVGANDGMVHVFDADTGIEVYAYVPSMLLPTLHRLAAPDYVHSWFADGQLASGDAKIGSAWKTLLAGGLGAGARGLFALDVTAPGLSSESSTTDDDSKVLWEQTGDALGYIHGKPGIARLSNGVWYVISGNGYDSLTGTAALYLAPVDGGTPSTIVTNHVTANGLSAPALVDTNGDGDVDIAFAGDLLGNLWKFDLHRPDRAAQLLFAAGTSRPITMTPEVGVHPNGGYLVFFGTGSLLSLADAQDTSQQTVYAIWDYPGRTTTITDDMDGNGNDILVLQTLSIERYSNPDDDHATRSVRTATSNVLNWSYNRGWKTDLSSNSGERVLGDVQLRGNRLHLVTDLPAAGNDSTVGESWLLELDWLSGGAVSSVLFDLNQDGVLNDRDKVTQDDTSVRVPIGISLGPGNRSQPSFARIANGADALLINGVNLAKLACDASCSGSTLAELVRYTCSAGTGRDCRMESGYLALESLLEEQLGNDVKLLELKNYLEGNYDNHDTENDRTDEVAIKVNGGGDSVQDSAYAPLPTGRISWIDLGS